MVAFHCLHIWGLEILLLRRNDSFVFCTMMITCICSFSLTLVDTLDTLAVLGLYDEFEDAVRKVQRDVRFDADLTVSVFETNIRMLG